MTCPRILKRRKSLFPKSRRKIEKAESIVIVEYKALTVEAITALRAKCRAANVDYCVLKNTLVKRALENKGIKIDDAILEGPNAFVFGNGDPVSARSSSRSSSPPLRRTRRRPR